MKNLLIGLFVIGLTSLGFSQNTNSEIEVVKLDNIVLSNVNMSYLEKVQDKTMSNHVKSLQNKASRFNVTKLSEFDGRKESFKTIFRGSKGYVIATYNKEGKILTTSEKYQNIKLPVPVRSSLFNEFPNWSVNNIAYLVSYKSDRDAKKIYKIRIGKDNLKKKVRIDSEGNIM